MDQSEFLEIVKIIASYWGDTFDQNKIDSWYDILKDLKFQGVFKTVQELAKERKYSPRINDIIEKYEDLKKQQLRDIKEKNAAESKRVADAQIKCSLCGNRGFVQVWQEEYEFMARCICAHGKDLSKYSMPQIDRRVKYINREGKEECIYIPTIQEVLSPEAFAIYKAQKKAKTIECEIKDVLGRMEPIGKSGV